MLARRLRWLAGVGLPLAHALLLLGILGARLTLTAAPPALPPPLQWMQWGWWAVRNAVSLATEFTPFLFLPLPLWALTGAVALLRRRAREASIAALPWLLFAALYGPLFVPRPAHAAALLAAEEGPATALRVMTFNVLEVNRATARLAAVVRDANPDVLVVQELTPYMATSLDAAIRDDYPYRSLRPAGTSDGVGTWSRYPIVKTDGWTDLQSPARWQYVALAVHGRTVHVANLHLSAPEVRWRRLPLLPKPLIVGQDTSERRAQVALLAPRLRGLAESGAPLVVAGDLNMTDQAPEYGRLLDAGLHDAYRAAGWGFGLTFPATPVAYFARHAVAARPVLALDHVLVSPQVGVAHIRVWPAAGGSDHRPLVADLVLPAATAR